MTIEVRELALPTTWDEESDAGRELRASIAVRNAVVVDTWDGDDALILTAAESLGQAQHQDDARLVFLGGWLDGAHVGRAVLSWPRCRRLGARPSRRPGGHARARRASRASARHARKVANLRQAVEQEPQRTRVMTWNAEENRPMLAVNEAIGLRAIGYEAGWQRVAAAAAEPPQAPDPRGDAA